MNRYACMLRAVNVSGQRKLKMTELKALCESLGWSDAQTYLQSGNVVLSAKQPGAKVATALSTAIAKEFGYEDVDVLVWDAAELRALIRANPFVSKGCEPKHLHVTFLGSDAKPAAVKALGPDAYLPDEFAPGKKSIYVHCPGGYGRTKLNNGFFERKLGIAATTRNWQTVNSLYEMTQG